MHNWTKLSLVSSVFFVVIVVCAIILTKKTDYIEDDFNNYCFYSDKMKGTLLEGVVTEKFRDKSSHLDPAFKLGKTKGRTIHPYGEDSDFYEFIEIGDSLYKPIGSLKVKIFRDTSLTTWQLRYFDCE